MRLLEIPDNDALFKKAAETCKVWQKKGLETIAVVCRNQECAQAAANILRTYIEVIESDLEKAVFGNGIMVLPVEYTKGLEFDAVLILNPTREEYPVDDGHAKLLYVAATRALHELCILHTGNLTGLIADPLPDKPVSEKSLPKKAIQTTGDAIIIPRKKVFIARANSSDIVQKNISKRSKPTAQTAEINNNPKTAPKNPGLHQKSESAKTEILFGDMPATEKLRPAGHSKIDLAIRWVTKQPDGLYLQSRYGILRLSPVGSAIVRVTFTKGQQPSTDRNSKIAVDYIDKTWMYRESGSNVELMTDELCLRIDKATGAIQYLTRDKKLLLAERSRECRQIETDVNGKGKTWLFFDWQKGENLYGMGTKDKTGIGLRGTARYISHGSDSDELPFLLSDNGYGILMATEGPAMCCDVSTYGSYLYTENEAEIDFYFIAGKQQNTILNAYAYLCGRL